MSNILNDQSLDIIFRTARTYNGWQDRDVSDVLIQAVYDLMKWGPTSANSCPARFLFVRTKEAKERLKPLMDEGNREKTMKAPFTVIIANDLKFYENLDILFPQANARSWFEGKPDKIQETAMRNGTLQGAYFMIAARALGLDCGPMSGFNANGIKKEFFPNKDIQVNFLCNIGYGDKESLYERNPRLGFDQVGEII